MTAATFTPWNASRCRRWASVTKQLQGRHTDILTVTPGSSQSSGARAGAGSLTRLKQADADAIALLDGFDAVTPVVSGNAQVIAGSELVHLRASSLAQL